YGVVAERAGDRVRLPVSAKPDINDRLLTALDLAPAKGRPSRAGQAVRDTKETRIVCAVDLDSAGPVSIQTGVGFFDHMLEQVAAHGGFSLRLACEGDLHTDPHHTIEDSAIALGQALKQALGERRGIARYGFVLPMDEAEAKVSIDLSGRPYPAFEGTFATPFIGEYRTDLTAHVFRSLAEHLGAAIHVSVTGVDDHHKTEAVYKAFGRALRQAIRIEGDVVPSTKGVL
ncbi:MAG: imidazoleglycerol-phosphate dehydratase HisB, partial [Caulobacteraceae bacterium]